MQCVVAIVVGFTVAAAVDACEQEAYASSELPCDDQECSNMGPTLRVLESFPVHVTDVDEPAEKRAKRLKEIAAAIDGATAVPLERAALLTLVRYESHAAAYVHEGRCADGPRGKRECDSGRAVGHFQLHPNDNHPVIPESVAEQAPIAVALWRSGRSTCRQVVNDDVVGAFSAFATGGKCGWGGGRKACRNRPSNRGEALK